MLILSHLTHLRLSNYLPKEFSSFKSHSSLEASFVLAVKTSPYALELENEAFTV